MEPTPASRVGTAPWFQQPADCIACHCGGLWPRNAFYHNDCPECQGKEMKRVHSPAVLEVMQAQDEGMDLQSAMALGAMLAKQTEKLLRCPKCNKYQLSLIVRKDESPICDICLHKQRLLDRLAAGGSILGDGVQSRFGSKR